MMLDFGITGRLFRLCEVVMRLAYVNLLWVLFTALGLGLFGIFPATVALFTVTRKWVMGDHDIPIFSTFWHTYRKEFFKSTLFGFILFVIGYIIYVDLVYLPTGDRKSTRLNSSHVSISYAVFCLKKKRMNCAESLDATRYAR